MGQLAQFKLGLKTMQPQLRMGGFQLGGLLQAAQCFGFALQFAQSFAAITPALGIGGLQRAGLLEQRQGLGGFAQTQLDRTQVGEGGRPVGQQLQRVFKTGLGFRQGTAFNLGQPLYKELFGGFKWHGQHLLVRRPPESKPPPA